VAREAGQRAVADAARFGPILKAHLESRPVQGERGILAEEAIGGVVHFVPEPSGARVVVTRDEERIGAARRRFGDKAVDDILAREPLIVAEAQRP
jgi:hypothetical protein